MHQYKRIFSNLFGVGSYRDFKIGDTLQWQCAVSKDCDITALMTIKADGLEFFVYEKRLAGAGQNSSIPPLLGFRLVDDEVKDPKGIMASDLADDKVGLLSRFINLVSGVAYEKR